MILVLNMEMCNISAITSYSILTKVLPVNASYFPENILNQGNQHIETQLVEDEHQK